MRDRRVSGPLLLMAMGLVAVAAAVAVQPVTHGDNYCGRLFFDTVRTGACHRPMTARTWIVLALCGNAGVMTVPTLLGLSRRQALASACGAAAFVFALVGINRLLEPTESAYCGSVLNRHYSSEAASESDCDHRLAPRRRAAMAAFVGATLAGSTSVVLQIAHAKCRRT